MEPIHNMAGLAPYNYGWTYPYAYYSAAGNHNSVPAHPAQERMAVIRN